MATKQLDIIVTSNTQQLDEAKNKLGELKDMGKGLKIQYDIDGKPIDVVLDKSLNLQKQVKLLTAELRRTKEGTAEFALLSSKLNDAKDNLDRVNAKSKDLFGTLSLIPGPIGEIAGKLNGAIGLLKTFSGFSLKDVGNQFKELKNDIKDIINNFLGFTDSVDDVTAGTDAATQATGNFRDAVADSADLTEKAINSSRRYASSLDLEGKALQNLARAQRLGKIANEDWGIGAAKNAETGKYAAAIIDKQGNAVRFLTTQEIALAAANKNVTVTTEGMVVAEKAATFWTTTLGTTIKTVLISTGILLAIVVLGELVAWLYKYIKGTEDSEAATRSFTNALEAEQRALDLDVNALEAASKAAVTRAKIAGKSEEEIYKTQKYFNEEKLKDLKEYDNKLYEQREKLSRETKIKGEDREKLTKEINDKILKNGIDIQNQINLIQQAGLDEELRVKEKQKAASKKLTDDNKKNLEDRLKNEKDANKTFSDLRNQNILDAMQDERFKQRSELEFQKAAEQEKIDALEISEELKGKLKEQIAIKYDLKSKQLKKKFDAEDEKNAEDFLNKLSDISIAAIEKEIDRNVAAREEKYSRDRRDLEKDKEFIKMSEDAKAFYREELLKAKEEDIRKIKIDAAIKTYNDELTLLQAQQKNLLEGTDAYYQNQLKIEENAYKTKLKNAEKNNEDTAAITKEHEENLKNIRLQGFIAEKQLQIQRAGVIASIGQSLQELAGKNKDVAIAGIVIQKAAGIAEIIMNTQIANAKALATLGPIAGPIWVGINTVAAAASVAATISAAIKGINEIKNAGKTDASAASGTAAAPQANYGKNYGDGGMINGPRHAQGGTMINAEGGEAVMTRGAVTMFKPLLSMMNQMGGGTSFVPNMTTTSYDNPKTANPSEESKPMVIKSYVVSSELTSEQQRQARLKDLSTL